MRLNIEQQANNLWIIRGGPNSSFADDFLKKSIIAVGGADLDDLSNYRNEAEIYQQFEKKYSDKNGYWLKLICTFIFKIGIGDIVLTPTTNVNKLFIGIVTSEYIFNENFINKDYPHIRNVKWICRINKSEIESNLLKSLRHTRRTISNVNVHLNKVKKILNNAPLHPNSSEHIDLMYLSRFKAFDEKVTIPFSPLTIVAGVNSSGKTSLIHAILLLRQTLLSKPRFLDESPLDINGAYLKINAFNELIYDKKKGDSFEISFQVSVNMTDNMLKKYGVIHNFSGKNEHCFIQTIFEFSLFNNYKEILSKTQMTLFADNGDTCTELINLIINQNKKTKSPIKFRINKSNIEVPGYIEFDHFIPFWRKPRFLEQDDHHFQYYELYTNLFSPVLNIIRNELLNNIKYLGPLRSKPERLYEFSQIRALDIGEGGEKTIEILEKNWEKLIWFVDLKTQSEYPIIKWQNIVQCQEKLGNAVNSTLEWMGLQKLSVQKINSTAVQAILPTLSNPETFVTIADVGFGVSQILPVLAIAMLSNEDDIIILEQPEIHLHPYAQGKLAEILTCLAHTGRRIIVETHSEHIINRIRRLVAEDEKDELNELISILFTYPPEDKVGSYIEALRVDEYGIIENWPEKFLFESSLESKAILEAGLKKRQQIAEKKS